MRLGQDETLLQRQLRAHGLDATVEEFSLISKRHPDYPELVLLKYSQFNSPLENPIVQQCRGVILDTEDDFRIVSYPYDKFFNVGEENASEIDWDSAKVYEKLDGSIVTLYWYKGDWHFATSGMPAASAGCDGSTRFDSFRDLIETTWDLLGYRFPEDRAICYMFELMTPENRVIVSHSDFRMVLHGARELTGGFAELEPEPVAEKNGWWCVNLTPLKDLESVLEAAEGLKACEDEGYVVRDSQWRRIKLKAPEYLKVKWLKGEFAPHRMLEAVLENEISEVGAYFPDIAAAMEVLRGKINAYSEEITNTFKDLNAKTGDRKEFAKLALEYPYSGILFGMLSGKYPTPHEAFLTMMPKRLLEQIQEK